MPITTKPITMRRSAVMLALSLPFLMTVAGTASADHENRSRAERRQDREWDRRYEREYDQRRVQRYRRDGGYAARANDLDPAGDYKGYPDWARVALSPRYGRGFR